MVKKAIFDNYEESGKIIDAKPLYVQRKQGLTTQVSIGYRAKCQRGDGERVIFGISKHNLSENQGGKRCPWLQVSQLRDEMARPQYMDTNRAVPSLVPSPVFYMQ